MRRVMLALAAAAVAIGMWMFTDPVRQANTRIDPGGPAIGASPTPRVVAPSTQPGRTVMSTLYAENMHSEPSIASSVVDQVDGGTELEIVDQSEDWLQIKLPDGRTGWVAADPIVPAASWYASRPVQWITPIPGVAPRP